MKKAGEFVRTKFSSLDGNTKVSFQDPSGGSDPMTLTAAPDGLHLSGKLSITDQEDLQEYAKLVSLAWTDRLKLMRKIEVTPSGVLQ